MLIWEPNEFIRIENLQVCIVVTGDWDAIQFWYVFQTDYWYASEQRVGITDINLCSTFSGDQ